MKKFEEKWKREPLDRRAEHVRNFWEVVVAIEQQKLQSGSGSGTPGILREGNSAGRPKLNTPTILATPGKKFS